MAGPLSLPATSLPPVVTYQHSLFPRRATVLDTSSGTDPPARECASSAPADPVKALSSARVEGGFDVDCLRKSTKTRKTQLDTDYGFGVVKITRS